MSNYFNDNDDDLFDDSFVEDNTYTDQPTSYSSQEDQKIDALLQTTKEYIDNKGIGSDGFIVRTGLITSFNEVAHKFIFQSGSLNRTIFDTLDQLTNGIFSKTMLLNSLEESIHRKRAILEFVNDVLNSTASAEKIKLVSTVLKVDLDQDFANIYFGSMARILSHVIQQNLKMYFKLCEQIGREPNQSIINDTIDIADFIIFSSDTYISSRLNDIIKSLK